jgi:predicted lipoprotein with Yx(FWY)xxD motif
VRITRANASDVMSHDPCAPVPTPRRGGRTTLAAVLAALVLSGSLASFALASSTVSVGTASSSALGERVAVSPQGRTLYVLTPETVHHVLCISAECLRFWPPLTVKSRHVHLKDGPGMHGRLGVLHRTNGMLQVTLNGMPLYRYAGDDGKAEDNGQGIESFGGTWHAMFATGKASTSSPPAMGASPSATPAPSTPAPSTPAPSPSNPAPSTPATPSYPGYQY